MHRAQETRYHGKITLEQSILRTLLYFDLFQYPLQSAEIFKFLGTNSITPQHLDIALDGLIRSGRVYRHDNFYSVRADEGISKRRLRGNTLQEHMSAMAHRRGRFIGAFPFVRAVMASGSFSKGYMDENSDLDFFVVTAPQRLWIARMLIALYKRVFLFNRHKYFCCNYFVTADHLEIEEKNLFTATELATLMPLCGSSVYHRLMHANAWVTEYFPNFRVAVATDIPEARRGLIKRAVEALLGGKAGDSLAESFRTLTMKRWKRLYVNHYPTGDFELAFKSTPSVSKNHPNHFQRRVLERYEATLRDFAGMVPLNEP